MAIVLTCASSKGGVGKSSAVANIATIAAASGYLVLVVDLDPNTGLAIDLGIHGTPADDEGLALLNALTNMTVPELARDVRQGLDMVVGGAYAEAVPGLATLWSRKGLSQYEALDRVIRPLRRSYDLIIVDTAPGDSILRTLAFAASDYVIVPTRSDSASIAGIAGVAESFEKVRSYNPHVTLAGIILFGLTPAATRIASELRTEIEDGLGGLAPVFQTTLRYQELTARASRAAGKSVAEYQREVVEPAPPWYAENGKKTYVARRASGLAAEYSLLTSEILQRLRDLTAERNLTIGDSA